MEKLVITLGNIIKICFRLCFKLHQNSFLLFSCDELRPKEKRLFGLLYCYDFPQTQSHKRFESNGEETFYFSEFRNQ
jgi:hypothetical protein